MNFIYDETEKLLVTNKIHYFRDGSIFTVSKDKQDLLQDFLEKSAIKAYNTGVITADYIMNYLTKNNK